MAPTSASATKGDGDEKAAGDTPASASASASAPKSPASRPTSQGSPRIRPADQRSNSPRIHPADRRSSGQYSPRLNPSRANSLLGSPRLQPLSSIPDSVPLDIKPLDALEPPRIGRLIPTWARLEGQSLLDDLKSPLSQVYGANSNDSRWWTFTLPARPQPAANESHEDLSSPVNAEKHTIEHLDTGITTSRSHRPIEMTARVPSGPFTINMPETMGLSTPWNDGGTLNTAGEVVPKRKSRTLAHRFNAFMLNSPFFPILLRFIIIIWTIISVSVAARIYHVAHSSNVPIHPSTTMALVIDPVALFYLLYTLIDEYTRPPIGLRSLYTKFRLVTLDVLFIILWSAELSIAFDMLHDPIRGCLGVTDHLRTPKDNVCDLQRTLIAFIFTGLLGWLTSFLSALQRILERLSATAESSAPPMRQQDYFGAYP